MKFSIVGSGNMAWFLSKKLSESGHHFEGISGRNIVALQEIASHFNTIIYPSLSDIPDEENHICFLAIKDNAISEVAGQLHFKNTILLHTSGATSIDVLQNTARHYGIFWPVYSIVKSHLPLQNDIPVSIEGNNESTEKTILNLAQSLTGKAFHATEKQRLTLHLSAVFVNNFTNHLLAIAEDICSEQNISFDYLKPIIQQTFERINSHTAKSSQSGPAIRGDRATIDKHLELLKNNTEWSGLYETLSMSIRKMYENDAQ
ncbi:MAG: DUF2520 domain-containing protein [Chitinophagaceae bacterium]|jgi:predicted short-subunit dehydrogenase-like oxidoreductase (DUF2520 family)